MDLRLLKSILRLVSLTQLVFIGLASAAQSNLIKEEYRNWYDCDTLFFTNGKFRVVTVSDSSPYHSLRGSTSWVYSVHTKKLGYSYNILYRKSKWDKAYDYVYTNHQLCKPSLKNVPYEYSFKIENYESVKGKLRFTKFFIGFVKSVEDPWQDVDTRLLKYVDENGEFRIRVTSEDESEILRFGVGLKKPWINITTTQHALRSEQDSGCRNLFLANLTDCKPDICSTTVAIELEDKTNQAIISWVNDILRATKRKYFESVTIEVRDANTNKLLTDKTSVQKALNTHHYLLNKPSICFDRISVMNTHNENVKLTKTPNRLLYIYLVFPKNANWE